jgi:recombination protein RecT
MNTELTTQNGATDLKSMLNADNMRRQFAAALPKHLTVERFCRVATTALTRTPKLQDCTQSSFFKCLLDLSALGLEPDGRRAHLIPYGKECTLILDYKGVVELAMRSGDLSNIHADKICDEDVFEYDCGTVRKHKIDFRKPRGEAYAYYALARFKDGSEKAEVMTRDEIDAIRKRSRASSSGPWTTDFDEMAKKTVFRRLSKWLPLSSDLRDAVEVDADTPPPLRDVTPPIMAPKFLNPPTNEADGAAEPLPEGHEPGE